MRAYLIAVWVAVCVCSLGAAYGQSSPQANQEDIERLFKTLSAPQSTEDPRLLKSDDGFIRFLGAPPGGFYSDAGLASKSGSAEETAKTFVADHEAAFGVLSPRVTYITNRVKSEGNRSYVRLQQMYNGLKVFGAQMNVQVSDGGGIACVASDIMRDPTSLDDGTVNISPTLRPDQAEEAAINWVATLHSVNANLLSTDGTVRMIYDPKVMGQAGPVAVVWKTLVQSQGDKPVYEIVLVDAHSGDVLLHYSIIQEAKIRRVYDSENRYDMEGTLVRSEGDPPCGIRDADLAYDFVGDTYDFYYRVHGRDGIDGAGLRMLATVRVCAYGCPMDNAFYVTRDPDIEPGSPEEFFYDHMYFGDGYAVDDVTAHELTHGVTSYEANFIYAYQSGALSESFSDIWGEYVDLTNGKGTDTEEVRWVMGEDVPDGAIRNMKDPTEFGDPDRVGSPLYWTSSGDNGGVHINCGVINKMCYLLTDGDSFNGYTIEGGGIEKTAKLFYECQTNLLTEASDFEDLYMQLGQATVNLGYAFDERLNVQNAAKAVEIAPLVDLDQLRAFRAIPTQDVSGRAVIALYWTNPPTTNFRQAILIRSTDGYPTNPSEGMEIYRGRAEKFLDTAVVRGTEYFYTLFVDMRAGFPSSLSARATAGGDPPDFLSEGFFEGDEVPITLLNPFDLEFSQILFSPTGAAPGAIGEGGISDYANYTATILRNVSELPVPREDEDGGAITLPMLDDGMVSMGSSIPFPFFGKLYTRLYLASNGYVSFEPIESYMTENFPSVASHFARPRISFLFADLMPNGGGEIWMRTLEDRLVATFENVPEWQSYVFPASAAPNTVQLEFFYSGHIRITYQNINVETAICGLSDGQGVPLDPATLFPNVRSVSIDSDLSELPRSPVTVSLEPIPYQMVDAGAEATFDVKAVTPTGSAAPVLSAEWDGPGGVPFVDYGDGTGKFRWQTLSTDVGTYTVRIKAALGTQEAYQDVWVGVGIMEEPLPVATNLLLRTNNPVEDPSRNRTVPPETELIAQYNYSHPYEFDYPDYYGEGPTHILWFKNNQLAFPYNNQTTVPSIATQPGDLWFFTITPYTLSMLRGMTAQSPVVTVVALPQILNVALAEDVPEGVTEDELPLVGLPTAAGPSTGGTKVILLGHRLGQAISVTFGGIEAESVLPVNNFTVEVVTPVHIPSPVYGGSPIPEDVVVTTAYGTGILREAFTFTDSGTPVVKADVNRDGKVDVIDVQLVVNSVLQRSKSAILNTDVNCDGHVNSGDIQSVVFATLNK